MVLNDLETYSHLKKTILDEYITSHQGPALTTLEVGFAGGGSLATDGCDLVLFSSKGVSNGA